MARTGYGGTAPAPRRTHPEHHQPAHRRCRYRPIRTAPGGAHHLRCRNPAGCYCIIDATRFALDELAQVLGDVGHTGFGRDSSTGLGKFDLLVRTEQTWPHTASRHALSLAPCAPDPTRTEASACFYQPLTRFGRHGNLAALTARPYKRPVLMMRTAAFLTLREPGIPPFFGSGLGGIDAPISAAIPATVHQGYAPLVPLDAELRP